MKKMCGTPIEIFSHLRENFKLASPPKEKKKWSIWPEENIVVHP